MEQLVDTQMQETCDSAAEPCSRGLLPAWRVIPFAGILLAAHPLLNAHHWASAGFVSYGFFLLSGVLGLGFSLWRTQRCATAMRRGWVLFSASLCVWIVATVLSAWADLFAHANSSVAGLDDFFYILYGVLVLLAIVSPDEGALVPLFFWLDGLQAVAAALLAYIAVFGAMPLSGAPMHPIAVNRLIWVYDCEDVALALLALMRFVISLPGSAERSFFRILSVYLWSFAICAGVYNRVAGGASGASALDVIVDLPFMLLVILVSVEVVPQSRRTSVGKHRPLALLIDNARPVLLGLALVVLSAIVARRSFGIAVGVILGAFLLYGLRSTMLQSRLVRARQDLEDAKERLEELVLRDGLTGIANRRCFDQRMELEWSRAYRSHTPIALLLVDIDHFKQFNDTYGHMAGDECLIEVARAMRRVLNRPGDLLARYGGEEFVVLLPETDAIGAKNVAARLRSVIGRQGSLPGVDRQVTISIGATAWDSEQGVTAERLIETADRALYLAKQNGRNRIEYLDLFSAEGVEMPA